MSTAIVETVYAPGPCIAHPGRTLLLARRALGGEMVARSRLTRFVDDWACARRDWLGCCDAACDASLSAATVPVSWIAPPF